MNAAIGVRLRQERQKTGLNQADFAALGGVSRNSQTEYENAKTPPNVDYLERLSAAGIDIGYVLFGTVGGDSLTADESEMVMLLRALGADWSRSLIAMANLAKSDRCRNDADPV